MCPCLPDSASLSSGFSPASSLESSAWGSHETALMFLNYKKKKNYVQCNLSYNLTLMCILILTHSLISLFFFYSQEVPIHTDSFCFEVSVWIGLWLMARKVHCLLRLISDHTHTSFIVTQQIPLYFFLCVCMCAYVLVCF